MHIFVVGLPASGKTTLCRLIQENLDGFSTGTDLSALIELSNLNQYLTHLRHHPEQEDSQPREWVYWDDIAQRSAATKTVPIGFLVTLDENGNLLFESPDIWDEALIRSYRLHRHEKCLLFEFSRGIDNAYTSHHAINSNDIYKVAFDLLFSRAKLDGTNSIIIHLSCASEIAIERNKDRRKQKHRAVSSAIMTSTYARDPFSCVFNGEFNGCPTGAVISTCQIPVISIRSDKEPPDVIYSIARQWIAAKITGG